MPYAFCSYEPMEPPDGEYGIANENGSFNGMVGLLERAVRHPMLTPIQSTLKMGLFRKRT